MGIAIRNNTGSYSRSLGNVYPDNELLLKQGIYDDLTRRNAFKTFYASFVAAGFMAKFDVFRLLYGGTATADKFNLINTADTDTAHRATFSNDSPAAHTISGFQPLTSGSAGSGRIIKSNFKIPVGADLANSHFHVFNTTSENGASSGVNKYLIGAVSNVGNAINVKLQRNGANRTIGNIDPITSATNVGPGSGAYDVTKKGLLSIFRVGTAIRLYDNGAQIGSRTATDSSFVSDGTVEIWEGGFNSETSPAFITDAKLGIIAYGIGKVWTSDNEILLNTMLNKFFTDLGVTI